MLANFSDPAACQPLCQSCRWLLLCFKDFLFSRRHLILESAQDYPQIASTWRLCWISQNEVLLHCCGMCSKTSILLGNGDSLRRSWCSTAHMTVCPARAPSLSRTRSGPVSWRCQQCATRRRHLPSRLNPHEHQGELHWLVPTRLAWLARVSGSGHPLHQDACTQHCICRISIENCDGNGSVLATMYKTSMDGGLPLSNRSWCSSQVLRPHHAHKSLPNDRTTCGARKRSHQRKNSREFPPSNNWCGPHSQARDTVPQRSGPWPGKHTGPTGHRYAHNKLAHGGLPGQTRTSGLVPKRGPPFAGNGLSRHQLCPKGLLSDHSSQTQHLQKRQKLLSEPRSSTSVSMNQCVHHDHCHDAFLFRQAQHQKVSLLTLLVTPFILNSTDVIQQKIDSRCVFWSNQ